MLYNEKGKERGIMIEDLWGLKVDLEVRERTLRVREYLSSLEKKPSKDEKKDG